MMKLAFPDWDMAKLALAGYAEDGVSGKLEYDPETATWYANLDNDEHVEYLANLEQRKHEVLRDFASIDWQDATNIQGAILEPPKEGENRLSLYLLDYNCKTTRGFKVLSTLNDLFQRKTQSTFIGSTCETCGKKMMVILTWEDVKPKKKERG